MHDPCTLIWRCGRLLIWHRDQGGVDGACGWAYPHLSEMQRSKVRGLAWAEAHQPLFQAHYGHTLKSPAEAESLMRGLIVLLSGALRLKASMEEISRWALELVHSPGDNFRSSLAFMPGYHSNVDEDTPAAREYSAERLYFSVSRYILRRKRPWWKHPRWHFWHWRFQVLKSAPQAASSLGERKPAHD